MTKVNSNRIDLSGQKYGRLTVISEAQKSVKSKISWHRYWNCICDCGKKLNVGQSNLRSGHSKSCGCFGREAARNRSITHGMSGSPEHIAWKSMRGRCNNKSNPAYANYGGRGISICKEWESFESFYRDMGPKPTEDHSIDRIDNSGDYTPSNCKWSTPREQCINRRIMKKNTTGLSGVSSVKGKCKWIAKICVEANKEVQLVTTNDFFEACCVRKSAENKYYTEQTL